MVPEGGCGRKLGTKPAGEDVCLPLVPEPPKREKRFLALKWKEGKALVKCKTIFHVFNNSVQCIIQHVVTEPLWEALRSPRT